jgi:hypothetical protein
MNSNDIQELIGLIRCLALQMVDIREDLARLNALVQKNALSVSDLQAAQDPGANVWDLAREKIRRIGTGEARNFEEIVRLQGPIQ